jgi:uncharacterized protein (TIGR04255 family)
MILMECTDHESFEHLHGLLQKVLTGLTEVTTPSGLQNVALQYVDEIRHPDIKSSRDWAGLITSSLVGPTDLLAIEAEQTSGVAVYHVSDEHQVRIGYGAVSEGFAVDPNGPLRVDKRGEGPFFRLDLEGQWTAPPEAVPPFSVDDVLKIARELHEPIRDAFENAITPQLRDYFRSGSR